MFDKLRTNQPAISVLEWVVIFIAADIPCFVSQGIAERFLGLSYWPAFVVGLILMATFMLGYFVIPGVVLSN